MDETQQFLEQLSLPDLAGQDLVVEMVVQRVSQKEDTESQEENTESQKEDTEIKEENTERQEEDTESQEEDN